MQFITYVIKFKRHLPFEISITSDPGISIKIYNENIQINYYTLTELAKLFD